ncbi:MAG TPA: ISL3 family transposase [Gemmataceae bacterium]|nr:ISL3 family transposase [Gemmataceae bacterium]
MSTSLLYHAFGIVGYHYRSQHFHEGKVTFRIEQPRDRLCCPQCGGQDVWVRGHEERTFRTVPMGARPTCVTLDVARVWCPACDCVRQVKIGFADPKKRYTRSFERYALDLCRHMTIKDVAEHLGVSWDTIKDIQARNLQRRFGKPKLHKLRELAIDEVAIGKGHRYVTVVLNLRSGAVVFVGDGKGTQALENFWKRLRRARAKVAAVATDMSAAYIRAVRDHMPKAVHVFDHFHVIKLFNEKLTALRRQLYAQAATDRERKVLKGTRWLLLKNPENLDEQRDERQRLEEALRLNAPLATAYYLKEDLRQIWSQPNKRTARRVLRDWLARARASGMRILRQFADTLADHQEGVLNYYHYRISTGPLEGTNNKIQLMKRQAYGFRDPEFFKLKILGIHETKHALVG